MVMIKNTKFRQLDEDISSKFVDIQPSIIGEIREFFYYASVIVVSLVALVFGPKKWRK
jgi:DNA-directed RNA polymerase subunit F